MGRPPRKALRTRPLLAQHDDGGRGPYQTLDDQPQRGQPGGWPAATVGPGRFAHQQAATRPQQGGGAFRRHGRGTESPSHHQVLSSPPPSVPAQFLSPGDVHLHARNQAELGHSLD